MEIGRCPRCSRPYTVSDVVGFGILRAREAKDGGPRVEYACGDCGRRIQLIPHGDGRYAPPGEPPPPPAPLEERRPPWVHGQGSVPPPERTPGEAPAAEGSKAHARPPPPPPPASSPPPPPRSPASSEEGEEDPLDWEGALALLGCSATDGPREIERAFRERSRTCHPDKVAHLDPDFQALAERKFKRLLAAYGLLLH